MSLSTPFIHRPVGTTLLLFAMAMAGGLSYFFLPVSALPQVEFPTINVSAGLPGASPETMASSVATPLERQFGRISGITEMTSASSLGSTSITLQFDLSRNIDAAARDVQAAINAAAGNLPSNLPSKPNWRKANPAEAPILILALTSDLHGTAEMYDVAASIIQQKLAQVEGVGQVFVGGGSLPAVRVELNPLALNAMNLGLDDVRTTLGAANANRPKGQVSNDLHSWSLTATDQLFKAKEYEPLIITYRNGAPVRIADVGRAVDSIEDTRTQGLFDGKPAISVVIFRQPGANIIATVDRVRALIPQLQASIPAGIPIAVSVDRTLTIRASVKDVEITLLISIALVILVVFLFLHNVRSTLIPSVAVPVSLIGTFGVMYMGGYSIDNLSLMALTIATGFVVDDAIVVTENITRYLEQGLSPLEAALRGAQEIGFTVLSISISLVAVFIPILLMPGLVGRLFSEFAVTLSVAVGISLVVSLTATPMMCAYLLRARVHGERQSRFARVGEGLFNVLLGGYRWSLTRVLRHPLITLFVLLGTISLNVVLFMNAPRDLFPQQDTARLMGRIQADQSTSAQAMIKLLSRYVAVVGKDPSVQDVVAFYGGAGPGGGGTNTARMFVALKPADQRPNRMAVDQVIGVLRGKCARIAGATLYFQAVQDLSVGGRSSTGQYQYTLQGDNLKELAERTPQVVEEIRKLPGIVDVNSDQQDRGLEAGLVYDRDTASRIGLTAQSIDDTLYDAFGQRQVSTMYTQLNQYHVVMEFDPEFAQDPSGLRDVYAKSAGSTPIPLAGFTKYVPASTSLAVNHQSQFPAVTISFNLRPGVSLSTAVEGINSVRTKIGLPASIQGKFAGTAQAFQDSMSSMWLLILGALAAVYIVLGILYESYIHPITIISTLPSAGVGAVLGLNLCGVSLSVIAFVGIILLIGIVKKNAILMIDFALDAERREGKPPKEAIFQACLLRFRPITMTTLAAMLGGLPLAIGFGTGAELRRPLGIAIVGGLIVSQALTLYTTPVVYLYLDRFRLWCRGIFGAGQPTVHLEAQP